MSSRNHRALEDLNIVLTYLEPGRSYTNREVYDIATRQAQLRVGYSTVGAWLQDMALAQHMENPRKGVWVAATNGCYTPRHTQLVEHAEIPKAPPQQAPPQDRHPLPLFFHV